MTEPALRDEAVTFLAATPIFSELDRPALERLAERLREVQLPAGATLIREGEPANSLYIVVAGRLRASVAREGAELAVGEIGRGEVVGEMALLTDEPRSATVRAVRDSQLLGLSKADFSRFIDEHPNALFGVTRLIISRLQRSMRGGGQPSGVRTVAVVPAGSGIDLGPFSEGLAEALARLGETMLLNHQRLHSLLRYRDAVSSVGEKLLIDRRLLDALEEGSGSGTRARGGKDPRDADVTQWLHNLEATQDFVIYQTDPQPSPWTDRCLRQADRILLVANAKGGTVLSEIEVEMAQRELLRPALSAAAKKDLVLVHAGGAAPPTGTARWLAKRRVHRHHHVRLGSRADFDRLCRVLTDRQIGLVLSGGGARGVAHVGVLRALEEHGIPIDIVGGTSFGAIMGAGLAVGWNWSELRSGVKRMLVDPGPPVDYTLPLTALSSGRKATQQIRRAFGDLRIEDLWLPYFCVSSNLTRGAVNVHTEGPLWQAIRASAALPGIFPPVRWGEGDVLVDGGIMNNLPVDVMRNLCGPSSRVLAVNLRGEVRMPAQELPDTGVLSGWSVLTRRLNRFGRAPAVPGIVDIILRTAETGNVISSQRLEATADLTFTPPVSGFSLLDFTVHDELIEAGYRHALEQLKDWRMKLLY